MGLAQAGPSEYRHEVIGPFALPTGMAQIQVELSGSDASRFTDILTARFVSAAPGKGWVFSDLSAGGYDANSLLIAHSDCGPALATLGADVVFIMYGANDAGAGATPERFRDRLVADITFVRRWLGAQTPVVIIADVYRAFDQANAAQCSANLDRYPWAAWAVAQQDPLVAAVNARRALDGLGWRAGSAGEFLSDNVHYTAHGAIVKARMESQLMFDAWDDTPCAPIADVASVGGADAPDGQLTGDDVLVFIEAFIHGQIAADVAKVGGGLGQDGLYTVDDLVVFMRDFFAGCP
jgi:lysophospholipase L1-like esterase